MTAIILDGKQARDFFKKELIEKIQRGEKTPHLAIVQVGKRADSNAYIEQKKKFGAGVGVNVEHIQFDESITQENVIKEIESLNEDVDIDGIIVQLPLPGSLDTYSIIESIDPKKDVDGLTAVNVKLLQNGGLEGFMPATAKGIESLLRYYDISIEGKHAVVVGRSQLVGAPVARMLINHGATVTVCHSLTQNMSRYTKDADILVVAAGHPHLITKEYVQEGQVVIDVGINLLDGTPLQEELPDQRFTGDVDFKGVSEIVSAISPSPGGVGPMTVLSLFANVVKASLQN